MTAGNKGNDGGLAQEEPDQPDLEVGHWLVGIVDILGQKAKLREIRDLPADPASHEKFVEEIRETFGVVETIRDAFTEFRRQAGATTQVFDSLPEHLKPLALKLKKSDVGIHGVSDSVILGVSLKNNDDFVTPMNGVFETLFATCGMSVVALAVGHPVRGALEVGLAAEIAPGEVYGPALERAWYLEGNVAAYPRVLIGTELLNFLKFVAGRGGTDVRSQFAAKLADACMRFVTLDTDGVPMLDVLGPGFHKIVGDESEFKDMVSGAAKFVRETHDKFVEADDLKLGPRYGRLRMYFDTRLSAWGLK